MVATMPGRPGLMEGNVQFVDRTADGVALHVARGVDHQEAPDARSSRHVARPPWLELTGAEREAVTRHRADASPSTVFAFDFPAAILHAFRDRFVDPILDAPDDRSRRAALDEFRGFVLESLAEAGPVGVAATRGFDLLFNPPGAISTAFDPRSGKYLGLHLDDHEALPPDGRRQGLQQMGLNLGRLERYFQFVNHDSASLIGRLGGPSALPDGPSPAASLVRAAFRAFPDCPVLRITLRPGQGYIAATRDLIHDGATNRGGRPDVNALLAGRFDLPEGVT